MLTISLRSLSLAAVFGLGFSVPTSASALSYSALDIGSFGGGYTSAEGINANGQVVGFSYTATGDYHAFITGPNGVGMNYIGTLGGRDSYARDINDSGQVVGYSRTGAGEWHAFITGSNGVGMVDLVTLGGFSGVSRAYGVNASGQVVVNLSGHAYITGANGVGMTDLGALDRGLTVANDINTAGQVVGNSVISAIGASHAFITGLNGVGMTDLGTLGGFFSEANAINDSGQVVGFSSTATGENHAFITGPNALGMTDLGSPSGSSSAYGVNASGQVVGSYFIDDGTNTRHAFITGPNGVGITDLNTLVTLPGGDFLDSSSGINDAGLVISTSHFGHAYLISPVPEPETYALLLVGLGVLGSVVRRRKCSVRDVRLFKPRSRDARTANQPANS